MEFKENDIRPEDLEEGKIKALHEDLKRLRSYQKKFIKVNCPACDSNDSSHEFTKYDFNFDKCNICNTAYMNPRATSEILGKFYGDSVLYEYWDKFIFPASRSVRKEKIFRPRVSYLLKKCNELNLSSEVLVEIGSASGMFCEEAINTNKFSKVIGIEPSSAQARTCRELGMEVIESTIENVTGIDEIADIVVSFETIEHISSPREFIKSCSKLLKKGGLLLISCPNYLGFDIMTLKEGSDSLDAEHINMFNPSSLSLLVEGLNFKIEEISTPGELDVEIVKNKFLNGELELDNQNFLKYILTSEDKDLTGNFQTFIKSNLLSSHMLLLAIKQ